MSLVLTTDFVGEYKISQTDYSTQGLQSYIDKFEKFYLVRLLGADLYALFIADLDGSTPQVPLTAIYLSLYDPFQIDDGNRIYISEGMRVMLKQLIYFHYVRDTSYEQTTVGVMNTQPELGTLRAYSGFNLMEAYNEGIMNYCNIQWFLLDNNSADYPDENTQVIEFSSGI